MDCANSFSNIDFEIDRMHVQDYWNSFENLVVNVVDKLAPVVLFRNELGPRTKPPRIITAKINKRKRLSKQLKLIPRTDTHFQIKQLDKEIKSFFFSSKSKFIQSKIKLKMKSLAPQLKKMSIMDIVNS